MMDVVVDMTSGQEGGDDKGYPGWGRPVVQPEGHPRDTDSHEGWHIDGEDAVGMLSLKLHIHTQTAVHSSCCCYTILRVNLFYFTSSKSFVDIC